MLQAEYGDRRTELVCIGRELDDEAARQRKAMARMAACRSSLKAAVHAATAIEAAWRGVACRVRLAVRGRRSTHLVGGAAVGVVRGPAAVFGTRGRILHAPTQQAAMQRQIN